MRRADLRFGSFVGPLPAHSWTARCGPSPPAGGAGHCCWPADDSGRKGPPSAVTGYREGPSHALPGRKFGSGVDHGPTVFRREGRFVPGMDSSAVGQNLAPGNLRRGSGGGGRAGCRPAFGVARPPLSVVSRRAGFRAGWRFRSFLGPMSAHSWTARSNVAPGASGV